MGWSIKEYIYLYITRLSLLLQKAMEKLANFYKTLIFQKAPEFEALQSHQNLVRNKN